MPALVAGIHVLKTVVVPKTWMARINLAMTVEAHVPSFKQPMINNASIPPQKPCKTLLTLCKNQRDVLGKC
jgi:hypothetical protein